MIAWSVIAIWANYLDPYNKINESFHAEELEKLGIFIWHNHNTTMKDMAENLNILLSLSLSPKTWHTLIRCCEF